MRRLRSRDGYFFEELFHGKQLPRKALGAYYILALMFVLFLALSFFNVAFLLPGAVVFLVNLVLHYKNKSNVNYYLTAISEFTKTLSAARKLAAEPTLREHFADMDFIADASRVRRRASVIGFSKPLDGDFLILFYMITELLKAAVNFEVIVFYSLIDAITAKRESLHKLFCFIGEVDSAISVAALRCKEQVLCTPEFTESKELDIKNIIHPLIEECVPNSLSLKDKSMLLTGSNMSGKTTFIRTVAINALLAETIHCCFAEVFRTPYMNIFSSVRITDDISEGASYYLEEVLTVKRFIEQPEERASLFVLDEIFKGTNTVERIAIGESVLEYLNGPRHIVLVSTHDIELAETLAEKGYELYHFSEVIEEGELSFDYKLHDGSLTTRNAIRILELYGYPETIIERARQAVKGQANKDANCVG